MPRAKLVKPRDAARRGRRSVAQSQGPIAPRRRAAPVRTSLLA